MKRNFTVLRMSFTLLLGFFMVLNANAQSKKISMQGFLKDANGKAVADGNKVLTFKIYDAQTGGTALWTNVFSTVPVVGGVYAVQLSNGKNASNIDTEISSLPWNVPYYVGITVESETELTPRTEFTYAPYTFAVNKSNLADVATRALTADAVGGGVNLAVNNSDADIRTIKNSTSPIDRNIYVGKGSGALSSLYLYSNNDTTMSIVGGKVISKGNVLANAKVGIGGVPNPIGTLDVKKINTTDPTVQFRGTTYNSLFNDGTNETTTLTGGKSGANVLINPTNGGNVGIGTSSPTTAKLVINAGGTEGQGLDLSSTNSVANMRIIQNTNFGTDKDLFLGYGSGTNSSLHLYSNNTETMTVKNKQVSINVNPNYASLEVARGSNTTTAILRGTYFNSTFNDGPDEDTYIYAGKIGGDVHINTYNDGSNIFIGSATSNVGIGTTTNPLAPLHVVSKTGTLAANQRRYFVYGTDFVVDGSNTTGISVRAEGHILTNGGAFIAISDKRIKNILGITNTATDLATLNKIEVTDYKYKDEVSNGSGLQKKVIAQQLQEVYPRAIVNNQGIIPNVFAVAKETKVLSQSTIIITTKAHEFATGDKVKLILEKTGDKELIVTVIDANTFSVAEVINDKIFVYGKHVNDLLTVDYDAVSMLNVSATQELSKQIDQLKAENAKLQNRLMKIEASLQNGVNAGTGK